MYYQNMQSDGGSGDSRLPKWTPQIDPKMWPFFAVPQSLIFNRSTPILYIKSCKSFIITQLRMESKQKAKESGGWKLQNHPNKVGYQNTEKFGTNRSINPLKTVSCFVFFHHHLYLCSIKLLCWSVVRQKNFCSVKNPMVVTIS